MLHPDPRKEARGSATTAPAARGRGAERPPLLIIAEDVEGEALAALVFNDAKDRFFRAWAMIRRGKPVFEPRRPVYLLAARLYEAQAADRRAAIAPVQRGLATLILDTDDPDPEIDLDELLPEPVEEEWSIYQHEGGQDGRARRFAASVIDHLEPRAAPGSQGIHA